MVSGAAGSLLVMASPSAGRSKVELMGMGRGLVLTARQFWFPPAALAWATGQSKWPVGPCGAPLADGAILPWMPGRSWTEPCDGHPGHRQPEEWSRQDGHRGQ